MPAHPTQLGVREDDATDVLNSGLAADGWLRRGWRIREEKVRDCLVRLGLMF